MWKTGRNEERNDFLIYFFYPTQFILYNYIVYLNLGRKIKVKRKRIIRKPTPKEVAIYFRWFVCLLH